MADWYEQSFRLHAHTCWTLSFIQLYLSIHHLYSVYHPYARPAHLHTLRITYAIQTGNDNHQVEFEFTLGCKCYRHSIRRLYHCISNNERSRKQKALYADMWHTNYTPLDTENEQLHRVMIYHRIAHKNIFNFPCPEDTISNSFQLSIPFSQRWEVIDVTHPLPLFTTFFATRMKRPGGCPSAQNILFNTILHSEATWHSTPTQHFADYSYRPSIYPCWSPNGDISHTWTSMEPMCMLLTQLLVLPFDRGRTKGNI